MTTGPETPAYQQGPDGGRAQRLPGQPGADAGSHAFPGGHDPVVGPPAPIPDGLDSVAAQIRRGQRGAGPVAGTNRDGAYPFSAFTPRTNAAGEPQDLAGVAEQP